MVVVHKHQGTGFVVERLVPARDTLPTLVHSVSLRLYLDRGVFLLVIHRCFLFEPLLQLLMARPWSDVGFILDLLPFATTQL